MWVNGFLVILGHGNALGISSEMWSASPVWVILEDEAELGVMETWEPDVRAGSQECEFGPQCHHQRARHQASPACHFHIS